MGFTYNIVRKSMFNPTTGEEYVGYDGEVKPIVITDANRATHAIPKHLLKYVEGRGWHFSIYIEAAVDAQPYTVDILDFYCNFPTYEHVKEEIQNRFNLEAESVLEDWTEEDHQGLWELAKWLYSGGYFATVEYSF
jgi:hypothetical protein